MLTPSRCFPRPLRSPGRRWLFSPAALILAALIWALIPAGIVSARAEPTPSGLPQDGVWPLRPTPVIQRQFAPPSSPWLPGHRGADLRGFGGQTVRAPLTAVVDYVGTIGGRPVVTLQHGGFRTTYEPVASLLPVGTSIIRGEAFGTLLSTASHCAPLACLHWGLYLGDARPRRYADPLMLVGCAPAPVRLFGSPPPHSDPCPGLAKAALTSAHLRDAFVRLVGVLAGRPSAAALH